MIRRLRLLTLATAAIFLPACDTDREPSAPQPNIVLISVDSLRADHLSCYGYSRPTSPTLDRLAAEGALFEVVTTSSSWTLPAHAALFTGLPDSVHGVDRESRRLEAERRTLAEALQAAGYRTAGVWSGPLLDPRFGFAQGFDEYVSHTAAGDDWEKAVERSHQVITGPSILEKVDAWLELHGTAPFFLFIHFRDVHYDYIPPPPYDTMFDPEYSGEVDGRDLVEYLRLGPEELSAADLRHLAALYDGEIAWTDQQIGTVLETLDERGVADNTLVVVTSDHGEELFEHGSFGHKRNLFDESIRIPLVMRYPGRIAAGVRVVQGAAVVDVAPTLLELAGAEPLPDILGRSLVPLLEGGSLPRSVPAVSELVENPQTGEYLLAVRSSEWKILVRPRSEMTVGLWDLKNDPLEQTNVFRLDPELTEKAENGLRSALAELDRLRERHFGATSSLDYLDSATASGDEDVLRTSPNPIQVCDGSDIGITTLSWGVPGATGPLEIRVDRPDGKLFAQTGASGSAATGKWARDGMIFFLLAADTGEVLGSTVVQVTRSGCPVR